jgi:ABC-type phosphate transport system substrate-binding protein
MTAFLSVVPLLFWLWVVPSSSASDPVLSVTVNKSNPLTSITKKELRELLLGEVTVWPDKQHVILVEREAGSRPFQKMLQLILKMTEAEYARWLLDLEFRAQTSPLIKTLNSDEGANKFVFNVPGAIAITESVPGGAVSSQVKVLRVEGKLPGDPEYPLK